MSSQDGRHIEPRRAITALLTVTRTRGSPCSCWPMRVWRRAGGHGALEVPYFPIKLRKETPGVPSPVTLSQPPFVCCDLEPE